MNRLSFDKGSQLRAYPFVGDEVYRVAEEIFQVELHAFSCCRLPVHVLCFSVVNHDHSLTVPDFFTTETQRGQRIFFFVDHCAEFGLYPGLEVGLDRVDLGKLGKGPALP